MIVSVGGRGAASVVNPFARWRPATRARVGSVAVGLLIVGSVTGCSRDDGMTATPVERPGSVESIVAATATPPGVQVDLVVGTDDLVVLRSTAVIDTDTGSAHRTAQGAVGSEFDSAAPPPLTDFGETWFVEGEVYERAPGDNGARAVGGDLADFLFVDGRDEPVDRLDVAIEQLLEGWPATTVSDAELVDGVSAHHLRFERPGGDVVDVWVDDRSRIVRAVRISERAAPLELRLTLSYLERSPVIPDLPVADAG